MKRTLVALSILLLTATLAWAEAPTAAAAAAAAPTSAAPEQADGSGLEAAGCELADLAGLSADGAPALEAALQPAPTQFQLPPCPTPFQCNSITNCAAGPVCSLTDIGQCCATPMSIRCCPAGQTIKVVRCPCQCTGPACSLHCAASTEVKVTCS
jgi:hypothetical protein